MTSLGQAGQRRSRRWMWQAVLAAVLCVPTAARMHASAFAAHPAPAPAGGVRLQVRPGSPLPRSAGVQGHRPLRAAARPAPHMATRRFEEIRPAPGEAAWRIAAFRAGVAFSTVVLEAVDIVMRTVLVALRVLRAVLFAVGLQDWAAGTLRRLTRRSAGDAKGPVSGPRRRVVIVGAAFGGLACARMLRRDFDVTIVDQHDYFEYTPGILRNFVAPEHILALTASLRAVVGVTFEHGRVDHIGTSSVRVWPALGTPASAPERAVSKSLPFDYCVVACGSSYPAGIKAGARSPTLEQRILFWRNQARQIAGAGTIVIVGGGPVGVELAAEIVLHKPSTKIILVHGGTTLLPQFSEEVSTHCERWLRRQNVEVLLGHRCDLLEGDAVGGMQTATLGKTTRVRVRGVEYPDGTELVADLVFWCRGGAPRSQALALEVGGGGQAGGRGKEGRAKLSGTGNVCVDSQLRVVGQRRLWAVGDVMSVGEARDERLGHTAEVQARVAAHNIRLQARRDDSLRTTRVSPPQGSPREYVPSEESRMYCVSLGPYNGSAKVGAVQVHGVLAALIKWGIEWVKVAQVRERPVGTFVWAMVDFITARTVDVGRAPLSPAAPVPGEEPQDYVVSP